MAWRNAVLIIPSLDPDQKLTNLISELIGFGFKRIVVINDGSSSDCDGYFTRAVEKGCVVVCHEKNLGKGAAIKTGIRKAIEIFGENNSYITIDADGQHLPKDILKLAKAFEQNPNALVLGVRDFKEDGIPLRSVFGNRITSAIFKLTEGVDCPDTQTGLRGIPPKLEQLALTVEGDRYEYETNFLSDASKLVDFYCVPIQTVYFNGNKSSHFRTVMDSLRIYKRFLRFAGSSIISACADLLLFYLISVILPLPQVQAIFTATVLSRIGSGIINFILNRIWSFQSKMPAFGEAVRYGVVFLAKMVLSAAVVSVFSALPVPSIVIKIAADTLLFFLSYVIQKNWVFSKERDG